jgi:hypothetical protein
MAGWQIFRPLMPYPPFQPNRHANLPEPFFRRTGEKRRDRLIRYQNRCLSIVYYLQTGSIAPL